MPPKKTASATKTETKKGAETEKAPKKEKKAKAEKIEEAPPNEATRKTRRGKTTPKDQEVETNSNENENENVVEEKVTKPKKRKAAAPKNEAEDPPNENENGTIKKKVTKSKKAKETEKSEETVVKKTRKKKANETEVTDTTAVAKPAAVKAKRTKKAVEPEEKESQQSEEKSAPKKLQNPTVTNWEAIDFKCTKKNANKKSSNFHITSWNVDGLRSWFKKDGLSILKYDQPDIFCIQETKCSTDKLPEEVSTIEGYETLWCSSDKEGYAGVGIITKVKPLSVVYGIDSEEHDDEGRCITAEFEKFYLVNVYVPNAGRKLVTLPKRLDWNKLFKEHIKKLDEQKPVIVCGDMNVAHQEIDLANPKTNTKNAGFTVEERDGMTDFLEDGYVDTFRVLYPDKEKAYTFWTYMAGARAKNVGWRLDYFIVSERFMKNVVDNIIHSEVLGSDHCPLSLHINI